MPLIKPAAERSACRCQLWRLQAPNDISKECDKSELADVSEDAYGRFDLSRKRSHSLDLVRHYILSPVWCLRGWKLLPYAAQRFDAFRQTLQHARAGQDPVDRCFMFPSAGTGDGFEITVHLTAPFMTFRMSVSAQDANEQTRVQRKKDQKDSACPLCDSIS